MNKKGFTLIELLAIIVILAIIALIGTPIVTNIINTTRISAAERTCDAVVEATNNYYSLAVMKNADFGGATIYFGTSTIIEGKNTERKDVFIDPETAGVDFQYKNTYPQEGTITIAQDGTVTWGELTVNTYKCTAQNGRYTCQKPDA